MNKLLIIDGSNLLFQMFFGMPARIINHDGKAIQGTLGFVDGLLKTIRKVDPTHVAVLFDGEHENQRTLLDADYKSNRTDYSQAADENSPFSQLQDIYAALDYMKISHTETADCESDDLIAGFALTYGKDTQVIISSFDSDFFQLITDHVSVLRYRGDKTIICNPAYIQEKLGILPTQYADFKSMTGDTSDNIKGAEKVGPKTAAELLGQFGSLEAILTNYQQIQKPSIRRSIEENTERLKTNYALIKLTNSHPLPFALPDLVYQYNNITTYEVLKAIGLR